MNYSNYNLPTIRSEDWKYTDLSHLAKQNFELLDYKQSAVNIVSTISSEVKKYIDSLNLNTDENLLIFVDGVYCPDLSKTTKDFVVSNSHDSNTRTKNIMGMSEFIDTYGYHGVIIDFTKSDKPAMTTNNKIYLKLLNIFTNYSNNKIVNTKNFIKLKANLEVNLIEEYVNLNVDLNSDAQMAFNYNLLFEFDLDSNSVVNHYILQDHNTDVFHLASYLIKQADNATYNNYNLSFGGKLVRNDIHVYQNGAADNSSLRGLFMPQGRQHIDNHLKIYHNSSHGFSLQDYRGVLADKSHGVWNGMVYVAQDTKANQAIQSSKNLLLSSTAMIDSKPELQIHTDDVSCSHGATIGQLDDKAIFYLQSRGIPEEQARTMLLAAFVEHIMSTVTNSYALDWAKDKLALRLKMENTHV